MQILAGVVLLGVLVTFHELGHFLFAKWLGVRVLVFSVGFGPKLIGFKRGETEYRLSAIPLGGYIRMFGESLEEDYSSEEKKRSFMHQAVWRKSLIAFAGPLFNFILPVILFFFIFVGSEQVFAPKIGTIIKDGAAQKAGLLEGDTIIAVNGKSVKSFNEVAIMVQESPEQELLFTVKRNVLGDEKQIELSIAPHLHKDKKVGRIGIMPLVEDPKIFLFENSPLKDAGVKDFDEVIAINKQKITNANELATALPLIKKGDVLTIKREVSGNEDTIKLVINSSQSNHGAILANGVVVRKDPNSLGDEIGLELYDKIINIDGEPFLSSYQLTKAIMEDVESPHTLGIIRKSGKPFKLTFSLKEHMNELEFDSTVESFLGIDLYNSFGAGELISRSVGLGEAFKRSLKQTVSIIALTAKSLWMLVKREVPASQVGGPITLFDMAQKAAKKGLDYYIFVMCLLSVNLGLLNLLPIPALDGGHLLLFGIEAVQRKPLTVKTRAIATQIGIAMLLFIMALAIFNDLSRIFG